MPRKDKIHDIVRAALEKDGWTITHDPFRIRLTQDDKYLDADLAAERLLVASNGGERIVVEVKTLDELSIFTSFYTALGQYLAYRNALLAAQLDYELYLAVSTLGYKRLFSINLIQSLLAEHQVKLIVVKVDEEKVTQWIK